MSPVQHDEMSIDPAPPGKEPLLFGAVLAAGHARRFGSSKQLAEVDGVPQVLHAVTELATVCGRHSLLVTGSNGSAVHRAAAPLPGFLVRNSEYADGLAGSLRCAVAAVDGIANGLLLTLADQPLVDAGHLTALAAAWRRQPGHIVASRYAGRPGVPAIFPAAWFAALSALTGDTGARTLFAAAGEQLLLIDCADAELDIDRPEDLTRLRERLKRAPRNVRN